LDVKRTVKSPLRDILARNMRLMRAELGWSQEFLAAEAGVNRTYLSAVERSEQNISLDNIYKISKALKLDASKLIDANFKAPEK
jgi:transcriptional regulator with XRE-family HTH domain